MRRTGINTAAESLAEAHLTALAAAVFAASRTRPAWSSRSRNCKARITKKYVEGLALSRAETSRPITYQTTCGGSDAETRGLFWRTERRRLASSASWRVSRSLLAASTSSWSG